MPPELAWITQYRDWAVARGHLYRGTSAIIWGRPELGNVDVTKASELGARLDKPFCYALLDQLAEYEAEFGPATGERVFRNLSRHLERVSTPSLIRWLNGEFYVNQASREYHRGQYQRVPKNVMRAISSNPAYLANRGVLAAFFGSLTSLRHESA